MIICCEEEPQVKRTVYPSIHPSSVPASSCTRRHFIAETTHSRTPGVNSEFPVHLMHVYSTQKAPRPGNRTCNLLGVRLQCEPLCHHVAPLTVYAPTKYFLKAGLKGHLLSMKCKYIYSMCVCVYIYIYIHIHV